MQAYTPSRRNGPTLGAGDNNAEQRDLAINVDRGQSDLDSKPSTVAPTVLGLVQHPVFGGFSHLALNIILGPRRWVAVDVESKHLGVRVAVTVQSSRIGVENGTVGSGFGSNCPPSTPSPCCGVAALAGSRARHRGEVAEWLNAAVLKANHRCSQHAWKPRAKMNNPPVARPRESESRGVGCGPIELEFALVCPTPSADEQIRWGLLRLDRWRS